MPPGLDTSLRQLLFGPEYARRLDIFVHNLATAQRLQEEELGTAEFGVTPFSDLTGTGTLLVHRWRVGKHTFRLLSGPAWQSAPDPRAQVRNRASLCPRTFGGPEAAATGQCIGWEFSLLPGLGFLALLPPEYYRKLKRPRM